MKKVFLVLALLFSLTAFPYGNENEHDWDDDECDDSPAAPIENPLAGAVAMGAVGIYLLRKHK